MHGAARPPIGAVGRVRLVRSGAGVAPLRRRGARLYLIAYRARGRVAWCRACRRGGRAVECTGLENRQVSGPRGFESHPLRQPSCRFGGGSFADVEGSYHETRGRKIGAVSGALRVRCAGVYDLLKPSTVVSLNHGYTQIHTDSIGWEYPSLSASVSICVHPWLSFFVVGSLRFERESAFRG